MALDLPRAALAAAALSVLAACSGGGGGGTVSIPPKATPGTTVATAIRLVGVGDSLTAGEQSGGLLGVTLPNPVAGSPFPAVFPTQGNGFWALLWSQANAGANPLNPALSPLPLMNNSIGSILVPAASGAPTAIASACSGANAVAYSPSTALQARVNPNTTPFDVAVPGQLLHEALFAVGPVTQCNDQNDPTNPNAAQASLFNSESGSYYPILLNFGAGTTQVAAAVSLRPQITTVWLGSNDLLKFAFSFGAFPPADTTSFYNDTVSIIGQLQAAGSKVAVANLVDVMRAAYFTSPAGLTQIVTAQVFAQTGSLPTAQAVAASYGAQAAAQGLQTGGALTLSGLLHTLQAVGLQKPVTLVPGDVVPAAFAAQVQGLNDAYNEQIAKAVTATGATLVDVNGVFKQINAGGGYPVGPKCCSPLYGGGLFSVDGVHPSNTGYAIIANLFIAAIDASFAQSIPPVSVGRIYATDPFAPH